MSCQFEQKYDATRYHTLQKVKMTAPISLKPTYRYSQCTQRPLRFIHSETHCLWASIRSTVLSSSSTLARPILRS